MEVEKIDTNLTLAYATYKEREPKAMKAAEDMGNYLKSLEAKRREGLHVSPDRLPGMIQFYRICFDDLIDFANAATALNAVYEQRLQALNFPTRPNYDPYTVANKPPRLSLLESQFLTPELCSTND
ncbi:hypothetical protein [Salmonirosea aquatica]|uniref:Uncharacterized protein n=1 Tax=Salmonirosea aquatica TaxID=2654236 RepID=A0A7C9BGC1_9BACT|nr:hypothetical protein [Cytophagaceae bacterium SJW1-29]MPR37136.1 hypothetical protein [Cytophagaceae bacterium SJW1-29]